MTDEWNTINVMARGFAASIPRFVLATVLVLLFYGIGRGVRNGLLRASHADTAHRTLNVALGRIAQGTIAVVGLLIAFAAAFPGFTLANLVGALGIGGIAVGFAFKDIFENFLSGILILVTRPFRIGDQIIYDKYEGTVEDIHIRATWLKTYDGRRVVIPNSELFTHPVTVNTAFASRRVEYDFKASRRDAQRARAIVERVLKNGKDVLPEPVADVVITGFDDSAVTMRARWWNGSRLGDVVVARDRILSAFERALSEDGISLSSPTVHVAVDRSVTPTQDAEREPL